MKNYFNILLLFVAPMMIAPINGFSRSFVKDADHFSYANAHVAVDTLGPIFGENEITICNVYYDCLSEYCASSKYVFLNEHVDCENNLTVSWKITIDANNDGTIDYEYLSDLAVGNDVTNATDRLSDAIKDDNGNGIKDIYIAPTKYGDEATIYMPENGFIKGSEHKIVWTATDVCGNTSEEVSFVLFKDKRRPTPICVPRVSVIWMDPDGYGPMAITAELSAKDFMNKAFDNCTADEDLFYTFDNVLPQITDKVVFGKTVNRTVAHYFSIDGALAAYPAVTEEEKQIEFRYLDGEPGIQLWDPIRQGSTLIKSYKYLIPEENPFFTDIMVTVWDEELNFDFCWTNFDLGCIHPDNSITLDGNVKSITGIKVKNAFILVDANLPEFPKSALTNHDGKYKFSFLINGLNYNVTGSFESQEMQGLEYNDLSILERHLSGAKLIVNPYQLIAADVNGDLVIDQNDYILLKSALESKSEVGFTSNKCVVKSADLNFSNWYNYAVFIDQLYLDDVVNLDFVAIKTGDINGNHFGTGITNYDINVSKNLVENSVLAARTSMGKNDITLSPNPFSDVTTLSFFAKEASDYVLTITDVAGKAMFTNQVSVAVGNNTININSSDLGQAGSYICTLQSKDQIIIKRLVLVR